MKDNKILLSICIPTYNRIKSFTELLESIENQKYPLTYEVYIQDNDSSDNTGEVAKEFCKRLPNWHYEKNDTNIGGILNIKKCTEKAKGQYMIIIGDDDALFPHAFETIDKAIKRTDQQQMKAIFFNKKLGSFYNDCKKFENGFEWLRKVSIHAPSFISAVLWEREYWENFDYHENLKEFAIPQLHLFVDACHEKSVWGSSIALVDVGWSFPTTNIKAYFFYKYYAMVDCFEYPYLYDSVLRNPGVDAKRGRLFL